MSKDRVKTCLVYQKCQWIWQHSGKCHRIGQKLGNVWEKSYHGKLFIGNFICVALLVFVEFCLLCIICFQELVLWYVFVSVLASDCFLIYTHTHTHLMALCLGLPGWACTRKVKPIWILLKQETVSGSDISWAICKSALRSRQIAMPAPHHSVFYRPDALPAAQPTVSKHWKHLFIAIYI